MMKLVVLSCLLAAASASAVAGFAPYFYSTPLLTPYNYRGPLSLAPGQPADIIAADGRPLDTLEVNLDRSAHYTTKALSGIHLIKKRSVGFIAPAGRIAFSHSPVISSYSYSSPLTTAHLAPISYTAGPLVRW